MPSDIKYLFPNLRISHYKVTSPYDESYNCVALATGDNKRWWAPVRGMGYFWPNDVPFEWTLDTLCKIFANLGYTPCASALFEHGFEKVALYVDKDGSPSHAARLQQNGYWISKLGKLEDIEHDDLHALENSDYGKAVLIFKRALPQKQEKGKN